MKFFQHGGGRHLGFVRTVNNAIRSADPENPTLEPNMKWIGYGWPFAYLGGIWNPHFGGKGRSYGDSEGTIRKSDGIVSYRLSIVTIALSVTRLQFAIECLRRSNPQGVGQFRPKFPGVPLGVDP